MTAAPLTRRAATVCAGALALCLLSATAAAADTLPLPVPTPSPTDLVGTVTQTVNQVTTQVTSSSTPTSTSVPNPVTSSGATTGSGTTTGTTPTTSGLTTATGGTRSGAQKPRASAPSAGSNAATRAAMTALRSWAIMPGQGASLALPPTSSMPNDPGLAPNVAPLLLPATTHHYSAAAEMALADKHTGFPVRSLLLALAIAAAAGVAFEHVRVARGAMPLWNAVFA